MRQEMEENQKAERPKVLLSDLKIRTKTKQLIPFEPNAVQIKYLDDLSSRHPEFRWREGIYTLKGLREDILKARQQGFSTLWLALYFLDTINNELTQSIIIAHDAPATEKLFKIIHRFYEHLPEEKKRPKKYSSKREIEFLDIDSGIYVATAGSKGVGRGGTINNVHMSERAFWPNGDDVEIGLLEAVPTDGNATRETTANGLNEYYEEREQIKNGESNFDGIFFAWFENPENAIQPPANFVLTEEEVALKNLFGISDEQIAWRRTKTKTRKQRRLFPQENPATEEEAFLSSGNSYFDNAVLTELLAKLKDSAFDPIECELPEKYANLKRNDEFLEVWELPLESGIYVAAADTAEGLNSDGDHDYCSGTVWNAETGVQAAHFHARINPHLFGLIMAELGFWYNTALLGIERNNHGHTAIAAANYTANYPEGLIDNSMGLYMHQEYDEKRQPTERRAGFPTTAVSKYFVLDELATAVEEGDFHPRSRLLVSDMMRFVKLPGGKAGAEKGHDDRVMDAAIARRMLNLRPRRIVIVNDIMF